MSEVPVKVFIRVRKHFKTVVAMEGIIWSSIILLDSTPVGERITAI